MRKYLESLMRTDRPEYTHCTSAVASGQTCLEPVLKNINQVFPYFPPCSSHTRPDQARTIYQRSFIVYPPVSCHEGGKNTSHPPQRVSQSRSLSLSLSQGLNNGCRGFDQRACQLSSLISYHCVQLGVIAHHIFINSNHKTPTSLPLSQR